MSLKDLLPCSRRVRLLYVEDNKEAREYTLEMLQRFFQDIAIAEDGAHALQLFEANKFDLMITDLNMPHMNGLELIKAVQQQDANLKIIVLSAHNESGYYLEVEEMRVLSYLNKPLPLEAFINVLEIFCKERV